MTSTTTKPQVQVVTPAQADQLSTANPASGANKGQPGIVQYGATKGSKRAFERTGNVCIDCLMQTAVLLGADYVGISGGVITCNYLGRVFSWAADPRMKCTEVIKLLMAPPAPSGGERSIDSLAMSAQQVAA